MRQGSPPRAALRTGREIPGAQTAFLETALSERRNRGVPAVLPVYHVPGHPYINSFAATRHAILITLSIKGRSARVVSDERQEIDAWSW